MKIYYAHHIWKYNTKIEEYELEIIKEYFPQCKIINPNKAVNQSLLESEIMNECFNCVNNCDAVVFSSMDGVIGKGVYSEVNRALEQEKPAYYLFHNKITQLFKFEKIENSKTNRIYAIVKN